jgi:hypothetical protein
MGFYAVAHHGTAGLDSYGYAEVVEADEQPRSDQTTTVWGPYDTQVAAETEVDVMEAAMGAYREAQDAR